MMIDDEVMADKGFFIKLVNDEKGKGLFSNRAFKEGDVILEEKPVICCQFLWNSQFGYLACDNCLKPLETAEENVRRLTGNPNFVVPHKECCEVNKSLITECHQCGVKYCSVECQNEAFQRYHSTLCLQGKIKDESHPLNQLCETWKQMHYPPESASIMLLARMVAVVNQANDKEEALAMFSQFCHRTVSNDTHEIVHYLLGEKFVGQIDILQQMMKEALNTEYTAHWFTPDGFRSLLALVGTNGQGIGTSSFSRWVKNVSALELPKDERIYIDKLIERIYDAMDEAVGPFLNNEGSGLYVLQSSVNHSCIPNAVVEFPYSNNTLVLKAIRNIKVGEEICTSYLDECQLERSRHSRQQALSSLYLFVCHCDKCQAQANDPDVTSDEEESDED
ncbi:PREDICTED: SET and MYND domain-containing protein 5 [Acromyrmex echinatior]|uniref:Protein-lysine N-trimethyltransferase SMYD5 n=1 Tax=Acromyrmex echinatior TaxID=103372 RepID=F4WTD3_ACREC|nr:PREDICTED: SET and MYND domain-containing protein 5 [Acromyrmex echinatior]EGI62525.1 SET and MYND domain-containing protein 5 [Acromyrmex echinatior]